MQSDESCSNLVLIDKIFQVPFVEGVFEDSEGTSIFVEALIELHGVVVEVGGNEELPSVGHGDNVSQHFVWRSVQDIALFPSQQEVQDEVVEVSIGEIGRRRLLFGEHYACEMRIIKIADFSRALTAGRALKEADDASRRDSTYFLQSRYLRQSW